MMAPVLAALLVGTGLLAVVLGLASWARTRRETLEVLVQAELADPSRSPGELTELVEKAGLLAERVFSGTTLTDRVRLVLTRAGWSLRPGEFLTVLGVSAAGLGGVLGLVFSSPVVGAAAAMGWGTGLAWFVTSMGRRRTRQIEEQLPSVLQLLAGALEAGSSLMHALELVVEEGDPPLASEFGRVTSETRVGRPMLESLDALSERIGSRDLDWTVEAIRIQHETGGKLADTLRVLAEFMRGRLEVRGEVRALSAEARLSAKVLTALPLIVGGFFFLFRRTYFEPLYVTGLGRVMLILGAVGIVLGSWWMRRLVRVEV